MIKAQYKLGKNNFVLKVDKGHGYHQSIRNSLVSSKL